MKNACLFLAASMGMLAACSGLNEIDPGKNALPEEGELVERVIFEVPAIRFLGEDGETRASLSQEQGGSEDILFGWEETDTVGIYPNQGAQVYFSMAGGVGTNTASFDGGGWALRERSTYSCYYPFVGGMYLDRNAIPVSFAGQEFSPAEQNQTGEQDQTGEQASLPRFNGTRFYLASEGTSSSSGSLKFSFIILNTVIRVKAIGLPAGTYTKLSLSTDEPLFVQKGIFGLESMEITGKTFSNSLEVSLKDFTITETSSIENPALIYLTSAPVDLRGRTLTVRIYSSDGNVFLCERHPSLPYEANSWVGVTCSNLRLESESAKIYYTSSDHSIVTPASTEAFGGATIVSNSYDDSQGIIVFDKDVTEIGDHAFEGCTTLTGITLPETVESIGDYAFSGCINLAADNASANMTRMMYPMMVPFRSGESSFVIPESVTIIGMYAFQGCTGLTSITIPDGVTTIEEGAFQGCTGLTSITIPDSVTTIEEGAFQGCTNLSDITIPDIDASTIHTVFDGAAITSVTIAEGVTSIADGAFMEWEDLISVKLPSTLTRIGAHAFEMCSSLAEIVIPESVTYIGLGAFKNCSDLTRVKLPSSTTTILTDTFAGCGSLSEINIPSGLISIGSYAFECCHNLPNIVLPATVTEIGSSAFSSCDFTTFSIPQGVTSIQYGTFYDCSYLSSIRIPDSVESIDMHAFYSCESLTSVVIPGSVTRIENGAFQDCAGLSYVTVHAQTPPSFAEINGEECIFAGTNNCLIYVPSESLEAYKTAGGWSNYASRICDHVYVDMGNGMKWATTNVGAVGPDDLGQYFAWGRTTPLNAPDLDYNRNDPFIDTAHSLWGGYWRMPTLEEWQELKNTDHYTWTWDPVRKGTTVESKVPGCEGNRIFLPAAGVAGVENQVGIFYVGSEGNYWANALRSEATGWTLVTTPDGVFLGDYGCGAGLSVRPIYESNPVGNMENLNDSGIEEEI